MSSYLNIYLLPKADEVNKEPKKLLVKSVSRSSDLYQAFQEANIAYAYSYHGLTDKNDDEPEVQYTKIDYSLISTICADIYDELVKSKNRIEEYEKHAAGNTEIIDEIIQMKEYISEQESLYNELKVMKEFIYDIENYDWYSIEAVYANID